MGRIWALASLLCLIAAAILLIRENYDAAFVVAALGALAWILDYRAKIRGTIPEDAETTRRETEESEEDDDEEQ